MLARLMVVLVGLLAGSLALAAPPTKEAADKLKAEGRWEELLELRDAGRAGGLDQPLGSPRDLADQMTASPEAVDFRVVCILVDFWDRADSSGFAWTNSLTFTNLLFSTGVVSTGSMKEYWDEVSYGELNVSGTVVGFYRMPQPYSFYANGMYGNGTYPNNQQKLAQDAIYAADSLGLDFSLYDGDADSHVDAVMIVFAGLPATETGDPNDLWPVSWSLPTPTVVDGVTISGFTTAPEETIIGTAGRSNIGIFCYNLGKTLGLISLYDWDADAHGLGDWSLMASGSFLNYGRTPSHLDAMSRRSIGFVTSADIIRPTTNTSALLPPVETSRRIARLWTDGAIAPEYYLVENRQQTGFDSYLPGEGVLIYHVDAAVSDMYNQWIEGEDAYGDPHYRVALEQADGAYDLERGNNRGDDGDPWTSSTGPFDKNSYPSSHGYYAATDVAVNVGPQVGDAYPVDLQVTEFVPAADSVPFVVVPAMPADVFYAVSADLDRDSRADLIYSDPSANSLRVSYGRPDGTLGPPWDYLSIGPAAITTDFVNADTLLDIVAATATSVHVLLNQADRAFTPSGMMALAPPGWINGGSTALSPEDDPVPAVVTGLFDDDEILDMVAAPGSMYLGVGDGTFSGPVALPFTFSCVNSCDFNYDGWDDLVVLSGSQIDVYTNDAVTPPAFTLAGSVAIGTPSLDLAPSHEVADMDFNGDCDFVIVTPLASPAGQSRLTVLFWDRAVGLDHYLSILIDGIAYNLVIADVNRDRHLDIAVANSTLGRLEIYFGDGLGNFSQPPECLDLEVGADIAYVLAGLDLNLDGNPDFVSGSSAGGSTRLAYSDADPAPVIQSPDYLPMVTSVSTDVSVTVINPEGFVISRDFQTVAGSDYWRLDFNQDGLIEEEAVDYNVMAGRYTLIAKLQPDASPATTVTMGIGINGSQLASVYIDCPMEGPTKGAESDSLVFYYDVYAPGDESDVWPLDGSDVRSPSPTFTWDGLAGGPDPQYWFQLDSDPRMTSPLMIVDQPGLTTPQYTISTTLGLDNMYYWQVQFDRDGNGVYEDLSKVYALRIVECCVGFVGNVNLSGTGSTADEKPTIGDIATLIEHLFITLAPLSCYAEGDVNYSGQGSPTKEDITIGDIADLIDHLFISGKPLHGCDNEK